jgi:hypothetical protein
MNRRRVNKSDAESLGAPVVILALAAFALALVTLLFG